MLCVLVTAVVVEGGFVVAMEIIMRRNNGEYIKNGGNDRWEKERGRGGKGEGLVLIRSWHKLLSNFWEIWVGLSN